MASFSVFEQISIGITQNDLTGCYLQANQPFGRLTGYTNQELQQLRWQDLHHPDDLASLGSDDRQLTLGEIDSFAAETRLFTKEGQIKWVHLTVTLVRGEAGEPNYTLHVAQDITDRKQMEIAYHRQNQQRQLLYQITQQIRNSLDLNQILTTSCNQIRAALNLDRVVLYQFETGRSGYVVAESVASEWPMMLGRRLYDPCMAEESCITPYIHGKIQRTDDIYTAGFADCYLQLLAQFHVRANLVLPVIAEQELWGLLVAQQCGSTRFWSDEEVELLSHLSESISIAIQQGQLYQRTHRLNQDLEQRVEVRTQQLQQALRFEALIRRITEKIRQSLDQDNLLLTAVTELGEELRTTGCNVTLFDDHMSSGQITHDHARSGPRLEKQSFQTSSYPELFDQIGAGWSFQFCHLDADLPRHHQSCLVCPIADAQGVIGSLWLSRPCQEMFETAEINLVQHVTEHCAIGLRQALLYRAAQNQVMELKRLNLLKDDFLSTVSHELRTPLANIRMALYMLNLAQSDEKRQLYHEMALNESARQANLIDDLLNLQQLEAGLYDIHFAPVDLPELISELVASLNAAIPSKSQHLELDFSAPEDDLLLNSDQAALGRILKELLDNAHKHSAQGTEIRFTISEEGETIRFQVSNQGEIPSQELPRVFDKFYRIPTQDRWKQRGTGLGLALVQHLIKLLRGTLHISQNEGWIHVILWIPKQAERS